MSLSVNLGTALDNIDTLLTFEKGDIPVTHPTTGKLSKEDWYLGRTIKRYFNGFDPQALRFTFDQILNYLHDPQMPSLEAAGVVESRQLYPKEVEIGARDALRKVLVIKTYYDTNAKRAWLESNRKSAEKKSNQLQTIYETYDKNLGKSKGRDGTTKKGYLQRSISQYTLRITANAKDAAKRINDLLIRQLEEGVRPTPLRRVEQPKKKVPFDRTVSLPPRKLAQLMPLTEEFLTKLNRRKKIVDETATVYRSGT